MISWLSNKRFSPIGVDLGTRSVKLVQLSGDHSRLLEAARWDLPADDRGDVSPDEMNRQLKDAIGRAREGRNFHGLDAIVCLGDRHLFLQNIRVPKAPSEELGRLVQREAGGRLPFSVAEAEIRYIEAADVRQADTIVREVILLACHRPVLDEILSVIESAGLCPVAVDIEPAVVPLAEKYFGFSGEVTVADGRAFLDKTRRRFDAVILDTFLGGDVPKQLYTKEAFQRMSDRLRPDGMLAVHLIARPQHPATKAVARTISAVFPNTVALHGGPGDGIQHIYLLASGKPLVLESEQRLQLDRYGFTGDEVFRVETTGVRVLTDDRTDLDRLSRDLAAEHRRRSLERLRRSP